MYKLRNLLLGGTDIIRLLDNAFIPFDPANRFFIESEGDATYWAEFFYYKLPAITNVCHILVDIHEMFPCEGMNT